MNSLSSTYNAAKNRLDNYVDLIPNNTITSTVKSFAISFTISTAFSGDPVCGAMCGTLAATASLVSALVSPFFNQTRHLSNFEAIFRSSFSYAVAATVGLAAFGTAARLQNLMTFTILNMALRFIAGTQESARVNSSFIFIYA
jgi:hypothetical protein